MGSTNNDAAIGGKQLHRSGVRSVTSAGIVGGVILVDAAGLRASRPDRPLFDDLSVTVASGDRLGVVGLNGSGKSTLLRLLGGIDAAGPGDGAVRFGRDVRVGFLHQDAALPPGTVAEVVGAGWQGAAVLDGLGMADLAPSKVADLSGGQAKRVALARLLVGEHDLLVLDENTNHLDLDAVEWLESRLAAFGGGLVLVTHDRHVLDRVTTKVLELDRGHGYVHVPSGVHRGSGYAAYLANRVEREEQAAAAEDRRRNLARAELAWLRRGAPARTRKPKARIEAATATVTGRAEAPARDGDLGLGAFGATRLGSKVVELHGVDVAWPGQPPLVRGLDLLIEPGERLGVLGPNGSGKSSLLDVIAGRRAPSAGRFECGSTVRVGYYDQTGTELDLSERVRDAIAGPNRAPDFEQARLMERFWFDADAQWAQIGTLSGGERRRLQLLLVLADRPNVLLLDEPTNDLDLDTLRALEDFLDSWPGALVAVSHDRSFLDRTVTDVLALDGAGAAAPVRGGYAGWLAGRTARAEVTSAAPTSGDPRPARSGVSPSTLRRKLGEAERDVAARAAARHELVEALSGAADHEALARLGHELAAAEAALAEAEERWLDLAAQAEALGLT
jgi:ABC transport system ATP-binding/permease protein